jgi:hypothetical protein
LWVCVYMCVCVCVCVCMCVRMRACAGGGTLLARSVSHCNDLTKCPCLVTTTWPRWLGCRKALPWHALDKQPSPIANLGIDYKQLLEEADASDNESEGESDGEGAGGRSKRQKSHAEASPSGGGRELAKQRLREVEVRGLLVGKPQVGGNMQQVVATDADRVFAAQSPGLKTRRFQVAVYPP